MHAHRFMMQPCLGVFVVLVAASARAEQVKVVDATGAAVEQYETMWHTADSGYSHWQAGGDLRHLPRDAAVIDIVVRADGYATAVRRFTGDALAELRSGKTTITLHQGNVVWLKLNVPDGMEVPSDFLPQMYFPQFASRVRMMWQPANLRNDRTKPDFNMLNVSRVADRLYSFRLPEEETPFFVAFQHPGWLKFYEVGPLSNRDVDEGVLEIDVPRPASIELVLEVGDTKEADLPFKSAFVEVHWPNPEMDGSFYSTTFAERIMPNETRVFSDLGPGRFSVTIRTDAREGVQNVADTEINPGRFFARREISVPAGAGHRESIRWKPFDPAANRGDCCARLKLLEADGRPAVNAPVKVQWFDGHYGAIEIHNGRTSKDGIVQLDHLSSEVPTESPYGPYSVELDGELVSWFRLRPTTDIQDFEFRMVPDVGDQAPDIEIIEIDTGKTHKLSAFQGKVVLLEFWATWCGPCQPAMKKLNDMASAHADRSDQLVVIPLSVDKTRRLAIDHVNERGWTAMSHFWSRPFDEGQSQAEQAFGVRGIPTAILLMPDGAIAWRGHPMAELAGGTSLAERIEAVIGDPTVRAKE